MLFTSLKYLLLAFKLHTYFDSVFPTPCYSPPDWRECLNYNIVGLTIADNFTVIQIRV